MAKELQFLDMKTKKKFKTSKYEVVTKSERKFAVADSPSGSKSWRIMGRA
tara:strand:- start:370 stop:519 length:150 start_codon:yes stop_codon:yes gene_type:complete